MITLERTVHADRPMDQVFAYLSDFTNAEEWDPGTLSCRRQSGDGGIGTRYLNRSRFLGRTTELVYVVQRVEAPHTYAIEGSNATVTSTDTITVTSASPATGTEVTYKAVFGFHGAARWLEPLLRLPIKRLGDRAEETLLAALLRLPA